MNKTHPKVDAFLQRAQSWRPEMQKLRQIALASGLTEELKWRQPCYTFQGGNIAIIQPFKDAVALMFFDGVLLDDPEGVLEPPGENSRTARRIRFTSPAEIDAMAPTLKGFIEEAVEAKKAGVEVELDEPDLELPEELRKRLEEDPALKKAFEELTPGRQRGYALHVSSAKQSKTRADRVERCVPKILEGKGLRDR